MSMRKPVLNFWASRLQGFSETCTSASAHVCYHAMDDEYGAHLSDPRLAVDEEGKFPDSMQVFHVMAEARKSQLAIPRTAAFKREEVVQAFQDAFELIGGVPRFAAWAHQHETAFYKLYAKMLPSSAHKQVTTDGILRVQHSIQPGPLDAPRGVTLEGEIVDGNQAD